LPARAWQRLSAGAGAHGPREFDWARIPVRTGAWHPGRGHWLLARRSLADPDEIAYYACYGPRRSTVADLAWTAGSRWHVEECFQQAKGEAGLDHYQVRSWRAWHAHITFVHARPGLAVRQQGPGHKRGTGTSGPGMIGYTLPEIRRLLISLIQHYLPEPEHVWAWSNWRRRRQYQARVCHYQRRGYVLT
jgi:hypothetical protein